MDYKQIGIDIFIDIELSIEHKCQKWGIKLNEEEHLEILTQKVLEKAREYKNPLVMQGSREKLREYLLKYTHVKIDQDQIIDYYYNSYLERKKIAEVEEKISKINLNDLSKIDDNIKTLETIRSKIKNSDEIIVTDIKEILHENLMNGILLRGIESGISGIDNIVKGFKEGEYITIAARPGAGKTSIMCQMISNTSKHKRVAYFSAEMSVNLITNKILACETGIDSEILGTVSNNNHEFLSAQQKDMIAIKAELISNRVIKGIDTPNIHINALIEKAIELHRDYKTEIFFGDYIQLFKTDVTENRAEQIAYITKSIKGLARKLKVPFVALAQLNRGAEETRPNFSHLKSSGSIEEDSDTVIFLNSVDDKNKNVSMTEIIVAKNRNGKTGAITMNYNKPLSRFEIRI